MKIVILIKKKAGMSREDFIRHYETSHAVIGKRMLGHLWTRYVRNYPQSLMEYQPEANSIDDSYDAVTEIWLKDEAALAEMGRIINEPENNALILADEEKFQDRLKTRLLIVDEIDNGTTL
ncbi:EthD domain-containing protein [Sphingomonas profundi]|uniref:EthD domain-containing protein n=1 Tax=Alterirhizorhabdus profundi TaxID=2681549 RepID=UPI0012E7F30F|nr:EthD domain-containing protein [Sphingomonas profundi]